MPETLIQPCKRKSRFLVGELCEFWRATAGACRPCENGLKPGALSRTWGGVGGWVSGGGQIPQIQNGDGDGGDGFTMIYEGPAFWGPPPPRVLPDLGRLSREDGKRKSP